MLNQYFVKGIDGKVLTFHMTPLTHVSELKLQFYKKIDPIGYEKTRKCPEHLKLLFSGGVLNDQQTLEECSFTSEATAHAFYIAHGD